MTPNWSVRLFRKSILKQTKWQQITALLGPTDGLRCLDIGSDNGVFSYLLRRRGGVWKSGDLDERSVSAMRELVHSETYRLDGRRTPFADDEFDRVVIVDFLEHIPDDGGFIEECFRILRPGGRLIINAPHLKPRSLLLTFREAIGLTEEAHGHLRPGYTVESIRELLAGRFTLETSGTYTRFFSKFVDTLMVYGLSLLKRHRPETTSGRGILVTGKDLSAHHSAFRAYSLVYPLVWLFSQLDRLLFFTSGYMLIVSARTTKVAALRQTARSAHPARATAFAKQGGI